MFLTIKPYLHLNCVLMLNWTIWNRTVFDIKTVFTLNWIVTYNCLTSLKWKCFWQLNSVLMLNWIVLNRTDYLHKMDLALNNLQRLICHKTQQTNQPTKPSIHATWLRPTLLGSQGGIPPAYHLLWQGLINHWAPEAPFFGGNTDGAQGAARHVWTMAMRPAPILKSPCTILWYVGIPNKYQIQIHLWAYSF